jgi:hypothetical protein
LVDHDVRAEPCQSGARQASYRRYPERPLALAPRRRLRRARQDHCVIDRTGDRPATNLLDLLERIKSGRYHAPPVRRALGIVFGFLSTICLGLAGYFNAILVGSFPLFILLTAASAFFVEGGFSNLAPYTVEQYGVRLGARSSGLGQAANGVGKIVGPLALALLAGSSNVIAPRATSAAVFPAFVLLAVMMLLVALSYLFLGVETHGRPIAQGHEEFAGHQGV